MTSQPEFDRWWNDPDRACAGDERYADLLLIESPSPAQRAYGYPGRNEQIKAMQNACMTCPVYYECLDDLLKHKLWKHYGIRAGIVGAT